MVCRELEEQEKLIKSESIPDQTDEGVDTLKSEDTHDDTKKSTVSKGDVKHVTQDTSKKTDSKKQGTSSNKGTQPQATPDLEEEKVCRDYTMVTVSMGIALTGAKVKGLSLYEHLAGVFGKEVFEAPWHFHQFKSFSNNYAKGKRQPHKSLI